MVGEIEIKENNLFITNGLEYKEYFFDSVVYNRSMEGLF